MWLEAILTRDDVSELVAGLLPITIRLADDGELYLHDLVETALVPEVGLRVRCAMRVRWSLLGVAVPITLRSLTVLLRPAIVRTDGADRLAFTIAIEQADLAGVPEGIDLGFTHLVNRELEAKHVALSWAYADALSHVFELPATLSPPRELALRVDAAQVKATGDALGLAIEFHANVRAREADANGGEASRAARAASPAPSLAPSPPQWPRAAWLGGLATAALWAGYALGRTRRRQLPGWRPPFAR